LRANYDFWVPQGTKSLAATPCVQPDSRTRPDALWGDQDHLASVDVLEAYRGKASRMQNVELHIVPGVLHGFMMRDNAKAFHPATYEFLTNRALAILEDLKDAPNSRT
jgi:dienelactone hydrolase